MLIAKFIFNLLFVSNNTYYYEHCNIIVKGNVCKRAFLETLQNKDMITVH